MHISILLLLSNFFFSPIPINYGVSQANATVRGRVVVERDGRQMPGAIVYAVSDVDAQQTVADANGRFLFMMLLPGNYRLCAATPGTPIDCSSGDAEELAPGVEYGATITLPSSLEGRR